MVLLLEPDTSELIFHFEGENQLSSSFRLRNTTENHVAFKILCTRPRRYGVKPWIGILSPGGCCDVKVKSQAPRRAPPTNMQTSQSGDTFQILSVPARPGTTKEDAPNLFNTTVAHLIKESRLGVVYPLSQAQVAPPLDAQNSRESSATTSKVDESGSIVEASASQMVHNSVRGWNVHVGALILKCCICTFIVVVSCYLMKQTFSLICVLAKSMVMLMWKTLAKLVSEYIEDWVARTLICISMSLVCKYQEWLRIMLFARVWDPVMDLTNWKTKCIQNVNKLKDKMINFNLLYFS
ncbi:vesicle-associated protein 1-1-like isoform X2 [Henckelia pumila]|uniref:vesicle-associated protein 1-1-like isoform X2 n=1 Tax=Henckelia pumila TaxID=405737 RepID=UPI003C6DCFDB